MRVYFLRHGKSVSQLTWNKDDSLRPLTDDGVAAMRREAATLKTLDPLPDVVLTSPYTRARQTAEIVADALGIADRLADDEGLEPGFDNARLVRIIDAHPEAESIMLVGHEPDFSATIAKLIGGGRVQVKKGGLATVDIVERVGDFIFGVLVALLTPAQLRGE